MKDRDKASDIFDKSQPFFATKVSFAEAFPTIATVAVAVEIRGRNLHPVLKEVSRLDASNLREFVNCRNPRCHRGGFSIGQVLRIMVSKNETHHEGGTRCDGHEGTPRRRGSPCMTYFKYTVDIVYKDQGAAPAVT